MNRLILALLLSMQPAMASVEMKEYHIYHYGFHYPYQTISFIFHAPVLVGRFLDRKFDGFLARRAGVKLSVPNKTKVSGDDHAL